MKHKKWQRLNCFLIFITEHTHITMLWLQWPFIQKIVTILQDQDYLLVMELRPILSTLNTFRLPIWDPNLAATNEAQDHNETRMIIHKDICNFEDFGSGLGKTRVFFFFLEKTQPKCVFWGFFSNKTQKTHFKLGFFKENFNNFF